MLVISSAKRGGIRGSRMGSVRYLLVVAAVVVVMAAKCSEARKSHYLKPKRSVLKYLLLLP